MFGKGQGALGIWFKEFCELVFIQTLQAFLYAIIISFIVNLMAKSLTDAHGMRVGIGLVCVFAMVSVFKAEDLVRKIFGFGPTKADHGSAVKSIAKTAFAMQLGKRVLDNGKKVVAGASKVAKTRKEAKEAQNDFEQDKKYEKARLDSGKISQAEYDHNMAKLARENKKKVSEIKANRHEGIKSMASGVFETGGAVYGGTMGAVIGGADGDFEGAAQGFVAGMGIGDAVGQMAVNVADIGITKVAIGGTKDVIAKGRSAYNAGKNISTDYKEARASGEGVRKALTKSFEKEYKQHFRQISQLDAEVKKLNKIYGNDSVDAAN